MGQFLNLDGIALSKTQGTWRRKAEKLNEELLKGNAAETDRTGTFPKDNLRKLGEQGFLGLLVPEEQGGAGESIHTSVIITETLAMGDPSTAMIYQMHQSMTPMICRMIDDNEDQIERILQPMINGKAFGAFAMSEPGSGNRIWHMDSWAVEQENHYLVDSFKSFCTSAGEADFYIVPVREKEGASINDLSMFVVWNDNPGVTPIGTWDGMGLRGNGSRPIHFKDCIVPKRDLFQPEGQGLAYMMAYSLPIYLAGLASVYVGIGQAAIDAAVAHVSKRVHSDTGKTLAHVETVQRIIAEMRVQVDSVRALVRHVARMSDNAYVLFDEFAMSDLLDDVIRDNPDDPLFVELASLKPAACEMAISVTNKALQVCGGAGYKRGHIVERLYRDARAGSLMGPSDDTTKVLIGTQMLGLKQPWY